MSKPKHPPSWKKDFDAFRDLSSHMPTPDEVGVPSPSDSMKYHTPRAWDALIAETLTRRAAAIVERAEAMSWLTAEVIGWINVALDEQRRADSLEQELETERERAKENWELLQEFARLVNDHEKSMGVRQAIFSKEFAEFAGRNASKLLGKRHAWEK